MLQSGAKGRNVERYLQSGIFQFYSLLIFKVQTFATVFWHVKLSWKLEKSLLFFLQFKPELGRHRKNL